MNTALTFALIAIGLFAAPFTQSFAAMTGPQQLAVVGGALLSLVCAIAGVVVDQRATLPRDL